MTTAPLVLLDNTALTNFALIGRPDLIFDLFGDRCATTTAVFNEYQAGITHRGLPAHSWDNLTTLALQPTEQTFAEQLPPQLGHGERSCIAIAVHRHSLFICDDAKARREAHRLGIAISGTIGILIMNVRRNVLTIDESNAILTDMITEGYRSPVSTLDNLL